MTACLVDRIFMSCILVVPSLLLRGLIIWQPCCKGTFTCVCVLWPFGRCPGQVRLVLCAASLVSGCKEDLGARET